MRRALLAALLLAACAPDPGPPDLGNGDGGGATGGSAGTGGGGGSDGGGGAGPLDVPVVSPIALTVQPGGGRAFLLDALRGAVRSIRVVSYLLTDDDVEDELLAAAARGVEVRVIVEGSQGSNAEARTRLAAGGVQVREGDPSFALTHEKAVVVDDALAFVLNQNLTRAGFETNREFDASFSGPEVADLAAIFDADWGRSGWSGETDLVVSPVNSRRRLEGLVAAARDELLIAMEVFNDGHVRDMVAAKARAGVDVRVVLEDPADIADHAETARVLSEAGATVRWLASPELHAKAIVVDRSAAYLGSVNLTFSSLDRNREIGLVTDHPASVERIASTIEADVAAGRSDF